MLQQYVCMVPMMYVLLHGRGENPSHGSHETARTSHMSCAQWNVNRGVRRNQIYEQNRTEQNRTVERTIDYCYQN